MAWTMRKLIERLNSIIEAVPPSDPIERALHRINDAAKRGGVDAVVKATIGRIHATSDLKKLGGIVAALDQMIDALKKVKDEALEELEDKEKEEREAMKTGKAA